MLQYLLKNENVNENSYEKNLAKTDFVYERDKVKLNNCTNLNLGHLCSYQSS